MQFATNHLGHFALATGLHQWLAAAEGARVVSVASIGHLFSPVVFDDLHYLFRPYDQWTSYGQSKSANVLFAVGAAQRWADDGIVANALMPGNIASTALARHMGADDLANFGEQTELGLPPVKTIEQGAATSVLLAASPRCRGRHRPLLRRLRRGRTGHRARHPHRGCRALRARPRQRRAALAGLQPANPIDHRGGLGPERFLRAVLANDSRANGSLAFEVVGFRDDDPLERDAEHRRGDVLDRGIDLDVGPDRPVVDAVPQPRLDLGGAA